MSRPQFPRRRRLLPAVGNYPPSLVRSWLEGMLEIPGHTKASAMRELNEALGTRYDQSQLYRWLGGQREPDRRTRNYMLRCAISGVLYRHGVPPFLLDDRELDRIADDLS